MASQRFNAQYDDDAAGYDVLRSGWMRSRRIEIFADFLADASPGDHVAELGSGTGSILLDLARRRPDLKFSGIEPVAGYVDFARRRAAEAGIVNVAFHVGVAEDIGGMGLGAVQWWFTSDVLHHLVDESAAVAAVTAASAPRSQWTMIEPNALNPYIAVYQARTAGERNFRVRRFSATLAARGWQVGRRQHVFLAPASVEHLSPLLQRIERVVERVPIVGGGVVVRCRRGA